MKQLIIFILSIAFTFSCATTNAQFKLLKKKNKEVASADSSKPAVAESPKEEKKTLKEKIFGKKNKNANSDWPDSIPTGSLTFGEFKNSFEGIGIRSFPTTTLSTDALETKMGAELVVKATVSKDSTMVLRVLGNCKRTKMMDFLNLMKPNQIVGAFALLDDGWAKELAWFTDEKIYTLLVNNIPAIKNYKK